MLYLVCLLIFPIESLLLIRAVQLCQFQAEDKDRLPTKHSCFLRQAHHRQFVCTNAKPVKMLGAKLLRPDLRTEVPATQNLMEAIIGAFDESLGKVLKAIVIWT